MLHRIIVSGSGNLFISDRDSESNSGNLSQSVDIWVFQYMNQLKESEPAGTCTKSIMETPE